MYKIGSTVVQAINRLYGRLQRVVVCFAWGCVEIGTTSIHGGTFS